MKTAHKADCRMVFGRKDESCPRCQELIAGAAPRVWSGTRKAQQDRSFRASLRAHDCKASKCAIICTFGDW